MASELKHATPCRPEVRSSVYRERDVPFHPYFTCDDGLAYCSDLEGLMRKIRVEYVPADWRLFIDASCTSLKAVLLHNGNLLAPIPLAYARKMSETRESMRRVLDVIGYAIHRWKVCADFKVIGLLLGMKDGYPTYPCIWCLWDSRDRARHYAPEACPPRERVQLEYSQVDLPLISSEDVLVPPLHVKLGLASSLLRTIARTNPGALAALKRLFDRLSEQKLANGVLNGPQIRNLMEHPDGFRRELSDEQKAAFDAFCEITTNFLGNERAEDYPALVRRLVRAYQAAGVNMSLKIHVLAAHLDRFPPNCGAYSDEHGEHFHQTLAVFEGRWSGKKKFYDHMLADYMWCKYHRRLED
jgi:hypothetical protein